MRKISDPRVNRQSQDPYAVNGSDTPAVRGALAVARDYPVFPCHPDSKRPLTEHGFKEATQEPEAVRGWWRKYPEALIGVPTGRASGLVAIDVDPEGRSWLQDVKARLGRYRMHGTRRGKHLLYRLNGVAIRNSTSELAEGVDVRGEGGYIIWWPAHGGVAVGEPGELPGWVVKRLGKARVRKLTSSRASDEPADWLQERPRVIQALAQLDPDCSHDEWRDVASALSWASGGGQDGEDVFVAFSRGDYASRPSTKYKTLTEDSVRRKYRSFRNEKDNNITLASLYQMVKDAKGRVPAGRPEKKSDGKVILARADTIKEKRYNWLWEPFLHRGMLHVFAGSGGAMKSQVTLSMAATVTRGGKWPGGEACAPGNVVIWTGEDDLEYVAKPRLRFAGGDLRRCWFVGGVREDGKKREFDPSTDMQRLAEACAGIGNIALIIIDPVVMVVNGDNNSVSHVRRSFAPLNALAQKYDAAVLGIQHFNKGSKGKDPVDRITGSGAWSQGPRIALAAAMIDEGEGKVPTRGVFTVAKTFAYGQGGGFEYGFKEEPDTRLTCIDWGDKLTGTARAILEEAEGNGEEGGGSKMMEAKAIIKRVLARGPKPYRMVSEQMSEAKISNATFRRARKLLGVIALKEGKFGHLLELPDSDNEGED